MLLRGFKDDDLETLHAIDVACFPPGVAYSREELALFVGHHGSKTWVAVEHDEAIGFLVANRTRNGTMHIITLDVKEAWRRHRVGTALMDAAEDWGRKEGLPTASLETAEENLAAQAFYQKRGYGKLGQVRNYYANGSTAWVMGKALHRG
jgi:[ribosomal protein S18]-alanine N-acetyltransferase